jgi:hypothetical protein
MAEITPVVGRTITIIRKSDVPIRGEVLIIKNDNYILEVNGYNRTVSKGSIRKILD